MGCSLVFVPHQKGEPERANKGHEVAFICESIEKIESVVLVGQKSVIYYIQMVVVAILSVYLVESVYLVSVDLVVNCIVFHTFWKRP